MELIVIAFLGIFLVLFGHAAFVIAQSLLRRTRRVLSRAVL